MKRILSSAAIALALAGIGLGGVRLAYAQSASASVNVPTVVVTVVQALPLSLSSPASYQLYNGGSMVSMDSSGALTVNGPTEIRFIIQGADGTTYSPVGISFKEVSGGTSDSIGSTAFPMRTLVARANTTRLSVFDADPTPDEFEFTLTIQRSDGTLAIIDPMIINK
ncbi:MAG: hypothetical protein EPN36_12730 [Rhodanobacteraceae bacterium]|nr:MAG: hypothetical protein EPN36_12730 [Rhodanobacteraceae bacterium]